MHLVSVLRVTMRNLVIFLFLVSTGVILAKELLKPARIGDLKAQAKSRIIDGTPADNGQFPWQAFFITTTSTGGSLACGGTLIGALWVLTAAHCVQGNRSVIYLGDVNYTNSPLTIQATLMHSHPDYNATTFNNDIGLIALSPPVFDTNNVRPIDFDRDTNINYDGSTATVSGFGLTSADGTEVSATLNYVNVSVISNEECIGFYGNSVVVSSTVCAVGDASSVSGPCNGDSGGPLVRTVDGSTRLIGIVSFGSSSGCTSTSPSGFVRVSHFATWIRNMAGI